MAFLAGRILLRDRVLEGYVRTEGGLVAEVREGECPEPPAARGWVVPAPVNAHTHVADTFLRGRPDMPTDLGHLVGPNGWKNRQLASGKPADVAAGIRRVCDEMAALGTESFIDFREGGLAGVRLLKGLPDLPVEPFVMGRPAKPGWSEDEADDVLEEADGVALSAQRDFPKLQDMENWAEACHEHGKPFALHVSEGVREDMQRAVSWAPRFVVHAAQATRADLDLLADSGTAVVVCPRSNRRHGIRTPVGRMLEAGVQLAVGTDNGMTSDGDLLQELALIRAWEPGIPDETLLRILTWNGRDLVGKAGIAKGAPASLIVLPDQFIPASPDRRPGFTGTVVPA